MQKVLKRLILLLLIALIALAAVACSPDTDNTDTPSQGGENVDNTQPTINKSVIFADIKDGLINAGNRIDQLESGTLHVTSEYCLRANNVNVGVTYEANYVLSRKEDSEIMLHIYNYTQEQSTAFVYYKDNNLFYRLGGSSAKIEKFGSTSGFALFYDAITTFDLESVLFDSDFAGNIEAISAAAESNKISRFDLDENKENITVRDINLDRLKGVVNGFITDNINSLGTRLDALSNLFLGINVSDLGRVEIGLFNAEKLMTVLTKVEENKAVVTDFEIVFAGMQSNNKDTYYFSADYATEEKYVAIKPPRSVDPSVNNDYENERYGEVFIKGNVEIPYLGAEMYLEMRGDFNSLDNARNKFALEVYERELTGDSIIDQNIKLIGTGYYVDGVLYADVGEFIDIYLGKVVDYEALGLPKVKSENIDIAALLRKAITEVADIITGGIDITAPSDTDSRLATFISKVRSEDGVFYITIDSEFVSDVLGVRTDTVADYIASALGMDSKYLQDLLAIVSLDDLVAEISYDTLAGDLGISVYNGSNLIIRFSLNIVSVTDVGLEINIPSAAELATYGAFVTPETVAIKINGQFGAQGKEHNDISGIMGLLIGDTTGKNTPCDIGVTDTLTLDGYVYETAGQTFITLTISINGVVMAQIDSDPDDFLTLYIDNRMLGIKYIIQREVIISGLSALAANVGMSGEWDTTTIAAIYALLAANGSIRIENDTMVVSLIASNGGNDNFLLKLLGVEAFSGTLAMSALFTAPTIDIDRSTYYVPSAGVYNAEADSVVTEAVWESIYEAVWYNQAAVSIGDAVVIMELTYSGDSATPITGVYEYHPVATLFGQTVTYSVFFTDNVNGTSIVSALADYSMVIDPADEAPFPDKIRVVYTNGKYGELPYILEYKDGKGTPFPFDNGNCSALIGGLAPDTYSVVLGKGSLAETRFDITMTVLGRTVKVNSQSDYYNNIPIVARVTIDPYEYSLLKMKAAAAGGSYYPIRYRSDNIDTVDIDESSTLYLTFNSYQEGRTETVKIPEFDWQFDEKTITAKGGEYIAVSYYKTIKIALVVTVLSKEVDYILINDENPGYYTVDSLVTSTYQIPTATTADNEVRIYFKSGKYRIIGNAPADYVKVDPMCDGYYDIPLDWTYGVANYVTLDRSVNPLNNGRDNETTSRFGDDVVGKQDVNLRVVCPTRVVDYRAEAQLALTEIVYDDNGSIVSESCKSDLVRASVASFTAFGATDKSTFDFDPYSDAIENIYLPKSVYIEVIYRGKTVRRAYPVKWLTGLDGKKDNIIDADGKILNAFAEETYLRVYCVIGDGELTEVLTMLIWNRSGSYDRVIMRNADDSVFEGVVVYSYDANGDRIADGDVDTPVAYRRYFIEHLNPYETLRLPARFTLEFPADSGIPTATYDASWLQADDSPVDTFAPDKVGAIYVLHTNIRGGEGSDDGLLDQTIELSLSYDTKIVVSDRIYGLMAEADGANIPAYIKSDGTKIPYVNVDIYSLSSYELYSSLKAGVGHVGIGFLDGTTSTGVAIKWENLEAFLNVLTSPLGSSDKYNPGCGYDGDIFILRGIIAEESASLKQTVSLGFRVSPRILKGMNFNNLAAEFSTPDESGIVPVDVRMDMVRYNLTDGAITTSGKNEITIRFNKFYTLRGAYMDESGYMNTGLCTPSQYINYLFSTVSLSFEDSALINALQYTIRDDFDQIVYGNVVPGDPNVVVGASEITIKMTIDKITEGSAVRSFAVTLIFRRDYLAEIDYSLGVETFDEFGNPLFETQEGFVLPKEFAVKYERSGEVTYDNLVWHAENHENGVNGVRLVAGQEVKNIRYEFFRFTTSRNITLYADLPGGQRISYRLHFYGKNVDYSNYSTGGEANYRISNGLLTITNVYDVMPVDNLIEKLSTTIIPSATMQFESPYGNMTFELVDGWHPAGNFADENGNLNLAYLQQKVTSKGMTETLFAVGKIRGYNGETQDVNLKLEVIGLSAGLISHKDYNIVANYLVFDQYASDDYNGTLELPKDIKVTFDDVYYQFAADADIKYELFSARASSYTEVTSLSYNNMGHSMGSDFGKVNETLKLRVTLPDANYITLNITFPNRIVSSASYKLNDSDNAPYASGKYYIDPYDAATYTLPTSAMFYFSGDPKVGVVHKVKWTPVGAAADSFEAVDGGYRYRGGDFGGATYEFETVLRHFDDNDEDQIVKMKVVVLNRKLGTSGETNSEDYYSSALKLIHNNSYNIDVPFTTYVSDIPSILNANDFAALSDGEYEEYKEHLSPVVPHIGWYKVANAASGEYIPYTNDDISVLGGTMPTAYGVVEYGEGDNLVRGQTFEITFTADKWMFRSINGVSNYIIEINPFTMTSIAESFAVEFSVRDAEGKTSFKEIIFYPEYYADSDDKRRALIIFNQKEGSGSNSITLRAEGKSAASNTVTTEPVYTFDAQMIGIEELSFGFGEGFAKPGFVELVIDPINPVIPDKALATGKVFNGKDQILDLGEVDVVWSNEIYDMALSGGTKVVSATVSKAGVSAEVTVRVTYLDRTPEMILTKETGYKNATTPDEGSYYKLMITESSGLTITRKQYMRVDPINTGIFRAEGDTNVYYNVAVGDPVMSKYVLPTTLCVRYANSYDIGSTAEHALRTLGEELELIDVEWLLSRNISLVGTDIEGGTITASIRRFRIRYYDATGVEHVSEKYDYFENTGILGDSYRLLLSTINRMVVKTSVSDAVISESGVIYQQAFKDSYYIDPYDIKFPAEVAVTYTGSSIEELYTDIEWEYDEDYIKRTDVISGNIAPKYMYIMGTFKVYGTELSIQFAIRPRKINITVVLPSGEETSVPLSGGTIYVRKGVPLEEQLPTQLYYKFEYMDYDKGVVVTEIAAAPLKFSTGNINNIDNVEAGTMYTGVSATLGTVDNDNITFTIVVIDPKLYIINEEVTNITIGNVTSSIAKYTNGGFYYDYIPVGVNKAGQYVAGPETAILPNKVIVTDSGEYMDILDVNYNMTDMVAEFRCSYTFLSFSDSPNLSGDAEGSGENSRKMELTFTVPLKPYEYTAIEARSVEFNVNVMRFPIGQTITSSDMPLTTNGISPLWSFDSVNRSLAGEYVAKCVYKNAYGELLVGEIPVIFEKQSITTDDIEWIMVDDVNFLNRIYTGAPLDVKKYIKLADFLRSDGTMGPLDNYSVQFSIDGGMSWQDDQPLAVKMEGAPDYRVRIAVRDVDDYNVTGYVMYRLNIMKCEIYAEEIYFHNGDNTPASEVYYEYTGNEMIPMIEGIPEGATYELEFAYYDPLNPNPAYNRVVRPVNVGDYVMRMTFSVDQRNYTIDAGLAFVVKIHVTKPDIGGSLSIKGNMEYNGLYRDAIVLGLPEGASGIRFEYSYYDIDNDTALPVGAQIRDAGNYRVSVKMYGGDNWPSYNTGLAGDKTNQLLLDQVVTIERRRVTISIGIVESEYLAELKAMSSSVKVAAWGSDENGLVGTDTIEILGGLNIRWKGGELTGKHMVGSYPLEFVRAPEHKNYDFVEIIEGAYNIVARLQGAVVIDNEQDLKDAVNTLRAGDSVRWYLRAGSYGDLVIGVNASVMIVGSYNLSATEDEIAVTFNSVTVNSGDVTLDIVSFSAKASATSVYVGKRAGAVTITRSEFKRPSTTTLVDSVAIRAEYGYGNIIGVKESVFEGYKTAIYIESGALNVQDSDFYMNDMCVNIGSGDLTLNNNKLRNTRGPAVYIAPNNAALSIFDNLFLNNDVAISTNTALRNDIGVQNTFSDNAVTFVGWEE